MFQGVIVKLSQQILERERIELGPRPKTPPTPKTPRYPNRGQQFEDPRNVTPSLLELEQFLRERTARGVNLKTLLQSDVEYQLTRLRINQTFYFAEFAIALSSMEKYRDDILNNYMRYKSIEAGTNDDIDSLRLDLINIHKPQLVQVDKDIDQYRNRDFLPGDQPKMNDIIFGQYDELKQLDDELELLIGTPNSA